MSMRKSIAPRGQLMRTVRTTMTPQVAAGALLRDAAKWGLLAIFGLPLAAIIGPWLGRSLASLRPEWIGIIAVVITVMWAGNRALRKLDPHAPSLQPLPMARGVLRQPDGLDEALWPTESAAAHEAGHATACIALGLDVVDVTLKQVEITPEAHRKADVLPEQAWNQLAMIMAGRAGQERIGNHVLASDSDNAKALRIATRLHEHRAELPVDYDSPEHLVELARTAARQVLEENSALFEAIRVALADKRYLTNDDLTAVIADAHAELRP